jgi:ribosomal protein S18 acetylase RimI-like enzyme
MQIQLMPSLQGKGIGTRLLQSLVQEAREAGAGLKLSVLKANPARRLYERMGFVVVEEKATAYDMTLARDAQHKA